jgi:hypothetical protein
MPAHTKVFDHLLAAWNESDPVRVREHLRSCLAADVVFVDPSTVVRGFDAFEANIHAFRKRWPGATCVRTSAIDSHHNVHRYHWRIEERARTLVEGFDVVETDREGRVRRVLGFFGPLTAAGAERAA